MPLPWESLATGLSSWEGEDRWALHAERRPEVLNLCVNRCLPAEMQALMVQEMVRHRKMAEYTAPEPLPSDSV